MVFFFYPLDPTPPLKLKKVNFPEYNVNIYCDINSDILRPYVPKLLRRQIFNSLHGRSHPGIGAFQKILVLRFVWPSINRDSRNWARKCIACQRCKITRHVLAPVMDFKNLAGRFEHVHIDIITMQYSQGYKYCLTCIDRFSRWPEVISIVDMEASTVASAFLSKWISRYDVPLRITSDKGRQFELDLFKELCRLLGSKHIRTTAYQPQSNGMVERLHRQLKASIKCDDSDNWMEILSIVLLGIRTAVNDDLKSTAAEMIYRTGIRLPA